jgi:toxin ParE1/3/4
VKLIVSPQAVEALREIEEYIGNDNPKAAVEFVDRLVERFSELARFPGIGKRRDEIRKGYRSIVEGEYLIFYRTVNDVVEIMHVVHGKRKLDQVFK